MRERIGDDRNNMEIRETFWLRDADGPCRFEHGVRTARLGLVQGDPFDTSGARYSRVLSEPCRDPGETDGRVQVKVVDDASVWRSLMGV